MLYVGDVFYVYISLILLFALQVSFSACKDNQVCEDIEDNNMDVGAMTLVRPCFMA